jgi:hypothetical protein
MAVVVAAGSHNSAWLAMAMGPLSRFVVMMMSASGVRGR